MLPSDHIVVLVFLANLKILFGIISITQLGHALVGRPNQSTNEGSQLPIFLLVPMFLLSATILRHRILDFSREIGLILWMHSRRLMFRTELSKRCCMSAQQKNNPRTLSKIPRSKKKRFAKRLILFRKFSLSCAVPFATSVSLWLHRHRPQIAFPKKLGDKWKAIKGEAGGGEYRNQHWETNERIWRVTRQMKGDKAATGAKSRPEWRSRRETNEGRQGGRGSEEQPRMENMQGDKWRKTRRQRQPRAGQNGDHAGASQEQPRMEIRKGDKWRKTRRQGQPRAAQNGDQEGRQMKGDKAAGAAKSNPERRSGRETNEGRQGGRGSQEQPRMETRKGDKWWERRRQRQNGDHAGRQMKGDKAAAASRPFGDCGDQQPNLWEVGTPIASSYLGNNFSTTDKTITCPPLAFLLEAARRVIATYSLAQRQIHTTIKRMTHQSQLCNSKRTCSLKPLPWGTNITKGRHCGLHQFPRLEVNECLSKCPRISEAGLT